ncbi:alpha/beta fold hydrolase [Marinomonas sp.]|uniref:alpha/beta fold hydrolase n=1 Tax=Marinomonas sp. TaxID=1904862 RepID=UPI003BA85527
MKLMSNVIYPGLKVCFIGSLATLLTACFMPKEIKENEAIALQVENTPGLIEHHVLYMKGPNGEFKLHYVSSDTSTKPRDTVVFVHGTPGDWSSFARYFLEDTFKKDFRVISIDRPGWGKSTFAGPFPTKLQTQSDMLGPVLKNIWERNGKQKIILAGHSLGASLVPLLAANYTDYVRGVVILAGDIKPSLAEARWYNTILDWTPSFLIPDMWNHSNLEVLDLTKSLEEAQPKFASLTMPITIVQGTDDTLVNPKSIDYAKTLFTKSDLKVVWIQGASHIIDLQHPNEVIEAVRDINTRSSQDKNSTQ